jgi:hypothetical protein
MYSCESSGPCVVAWACSDCAYVAVNTRHALRAIHKRFNDNKGWLNLITVTIGILLEKRPPLTNDDHEKRNVPETRRFHACEGSGDPNTLGVVYRILVQEILL